MEHHYRVEENKPYGTWAVIELWEGGLVRSPFHGPDEAIERERIIAESRGFLDTLYLDNAEEALECANCGSIQEFRDGEQCDWQYYCNETGEYWYCWQCKKDIIG